MNKWFIYYLIELWQSTWGKVGIILAVLLIVLAVLFLRWINKVALKQFTDLQVDWPHFNWQAVEYRVRTAAELYFHGWNDGDLSALKPHMTPDGFARLIDDTETVRRKPFVIFGFKKPQIAELKMPEEDEPLCVVVQAEVRQPHLLAAMGFGWTTWLFETVYHKDGRWLIDSIYEDRSFTASPDLENGPDTSWMEKHPPALPHPETSDPQRPPVIYKPIKGKRRLSIYYGLRVAMLVLLTMFCLAIAGGTVYRNHLDNIVRDTGARIEADITSVEAIEKDGTWCVSYTFQIPGKDAKFTYRNLYGFDSPACVTKDPGESKKIVVIYLPEDPNRNLPVSAVSMITRDFRIAIPIVLTVVVGLLIANLVVYRKLASDDFSFFWPKQSPR